MRVLGLMSGTSADGIDAALVEFKGDPSKPKWEIINLGSDHPYSINYVIKLIENYFDINSKKEYGPSDPSDIRSTQASIGKAKKILNWSPKISIEEGIIQTCKWYEENEDWARKLEY